MSATKQLEAEVLKVYHLYWESYFTGNLEGFTSTLSETFQMIGTSEYEVAHNKSDGISFYKIQMQEVVGKVEMRNRNISAVALDGMFLVNEACDIYIFGEPEWPFYSKIRISTLLHKTDYGSDIPDEIKDKILQPFFTTKRGTEGTGLGLSISSDIIKAHGGQLDIQSTREYDF
jgi:hypothetical protein